jgi:hypothetical protein
MSPRQIFILLKTLAYMGRRDFTEFTVILYQRKTTMKLIDLECAKIVLDGVWSQIFQATTFEFF